MKIDRVKYTAHYLNGRIQDEWIGMEAAVEPNESAEAVTTIIQETVSRWYEKRVVNYYVDESKGMEIAFNEGSEAERYAVALAAVNAFEFQEDALNYLKLSNYRYVVQLNAFAKQKPLKNK